MTWTCRNTDIYETDDPWYDEKYIDDNGSRFMNSWFMRRAKME